MNLLLLISSSIFIVIVSSMDKVMSATLKHQQHGSPRVAVIGAGAAGLSSARVLSRNGISPVVLESKDYTGGVWKYEKDSKARPMYRGLRTNLPKEVMQFREMPWKNVADSFITHSDVSDYLQNYAREFDLKKYIKYASPVKQLKVMDRELSCLSPKSERWPKIQLDYGENTESDIFDAVFICNGHYAEPSSPKIPGMSKYYKGNIMHSVQYDDPSQFAGQTVLCIGGRASGSDLAREISLHANQVYLSDTTCDKPDSLGKVTWLPKTLEVLEDGSIQFEYGHNVDATKIDTIIFCSGYDYAFPFINDKSNLELSFVTGERRVMPLYQQLWHADHPNICFIGIPHSVVPFPLFELQSEAVWEQLNHFSLPKLPDRLELAQKDATSGGPNNGRIVDTHFLGSAQWDYSREMAKLAGIYNDTIEQYISTNKEIYDHAGTARKSLFPGGPDTYREIKYTREESSWKVDDEQKVCS